MITVAALSTPGPELPGCPDLDSRFGYKSAKKVFFGYKHHVSTDADSGMIVIQVATLGNLP